MDLSTLTGAALGLGVLALAMLRGGSPQDFVDVSALAITVGGTIAATLIHFPLPRIQGALQALRSVLRPEADDPAAVLETLTGYAERARREGVLALEPDADHAEEPFLRKALQLLVDGTDEHDLRAILEADLTGLEGRSKQNAALFESMAQVAPGFGMLGTLIGLIRMLKQMDSPSALGLTMATALLATFYGVLLANLVLTPLAGKVKVRAAEAVQRRELIMEGILSIQAGDTPTLLHQKLSTFLPPALQNRRAVTAYDDAE